MKFPVIILKKNESPVYFFDIKSFGLISKGGEKFYKNGLVYDSLGCVFFIRGVESVKKATLFQSIKYLQQMHMVSVKLENSETIDLIAFKIIIINHITTHQRYWIKRDLIESLKESIMEKNNFEEIINFLK